MNAEDRKDIIEQKATKGTKCICLQVIRGVAALRCLRFNSRRAIT